MDVHLQNDHITLRRRRLIDDVFTQPFYDLQKTFTINEAVVMEGV